MLYLKLCKLMFSILKTSVFLVRLKVKYVITDHLLNSYSQQITNKWFCPVFEFCVKQCQIWLFSSAFLCRPNALKGNKHVYTKTFVIATLFWEKWCIFWKSCQYFRPWLYIVYCYCFLKYYCPLAAVANKFRRLLDNKGILTLILKLGSMLTSVYISATS